MADMGLAGMGGAAGAGDALATLFDQRMRAAADQRAQQQQDLQAQEFQQNQARLDAAMRISAQEKADALRQGLKRDNDATAARQDARDTATFTNAPVGSDLAPAPAQRMQAMGLPVSQIPGQQVQQTSGFMPLPSAPPQGPGMQTVQGLTPIGAPPSAAGAGAPPPSAQGPQAPAGMLTTTPDPTSPLNAPDRFTRGATQADNVKTREDKQKSDEQDWRNSIAQELATLKEGQNTGARDHFVAQDRYDATTGKPMAGTLNTATGVWTAHPEQGSMHAAPGAAADAKTQADITKAHNVISQVGSSLDSVKDLVGPAAGRGETVEQWLGNADPKIQAFGVKLLLAKQLIEKSITGSARAAASPALMARWDNLFSNKVSYEGMKSALQAADEIIGAGSTPAGGRVEKWGRDAQGNLVKQ